MSTVEPQRAEVIEAELVPLVDNGMPAVVDGEVVRVIEIHPYPNAATPLGGCTAFRGRYVTDPAEIAAIARRVHGGA